MSNLVRLVAAAIEKEAQKCRWDDGYVHEARAAIDSVARWLKDTGRADVAAAIRAAAGGEG
jgi:hypothetical protein